MKNTLVAILFFTIFFLSISQAIAKTYGCGGWSRNSTVPDGDICDCEGATWQSLDQPFSIFTIPGIGNKAICCGWVKEGAAWDQCLSANPTATSAFCGETYPASGVGNKTCICGGGGGIVDMGNGRTCCGWLLNGSCSSTDTGVNDVEVSEEMLNSLNPLTTAGGDASLSTPGGIISKALGSFVFPIAGIILFVVLLLGGFQMLTGATNSKSLDEGKQRITAAIMGFLLLFAAYWIAQLLELIFGIRILS